MKANVMISRNYIHLNIVWMVEYIAKSDQIFLPFLIIELFQYIMLVNISQLDNLKLYFHCLAQLSTSLKQLLTSLTGLSDLSQGCLTTLIQTCCNKIVTRFMTQASTILFYIMCFWNKVLYCLWKYSLNLL